MLADLTPRPCVQAAGRAVPATARSQEATAHAHTRMQSQHEMNAISAVKLLQAVSACLRAWLPACAPAYLSVCLSVRVCVCVCLSLTDEQSDAGAVGQGSTV